MKNIWKISTVLCLLLILPSKHCFGGDLFRYAIVTATVEPTGSGTVYVCNDGQNSDIGKTYSDPSVGGNAKFGQGDVNVYFFSKPATGYQFIGWYQDQAHQTRLSDEQNATITYTVSTTGTGQSNASTYNIYAYFTPIPYTITLSANGGSGTTPTPIGYDIERTVTLPACPYTRAGYDFSGWKPADDVGNWKTTDSYSASQTVSQKWGNVTLNAQWTPKTYTITYDADGGTLSSAGNQSYTIESTSALKTATKPGYTFDGWKVTQIDSNEGNWTLGETAVSPLNMKYGNVTLKAQWATADITIQVTGLAEGETIMFTVKKDNATLYTVPVTGKASGSVSVTIKDLPTGSGYSVAPVQGWNFAYDGLNQQDTFGLGASGQTSSFTLTKKSSVKKYDEQSKVNWGL